MLFNSPIFIYLFLPFVVLAGNALRTRFENKSYFIVFLSIASIFFYGYTEYKWTFIILFSIMFNYMLARHFIDSANSALRKPMMIFGVAVNLALLGYFKYTDFLLANVNELFGTSLPFLGIVLPIGISFYTFQQIAFLVDAYRAKVTHFTFRRYLFFITFFPQLIAGPIVHHAEILPQLARRWRSDLTSDIALGLFIFLIGLTKKALLADSFAGIATPIFDSADGGAVLTTQEAWVGALAYALQIYFDFSGYSDMAIGIARMFGLRLPINFNSPYKSVGIIDFWRRWHITLSRFLRDYLYIPLGGNRGSSFATYRGAALSQPSDHHAARRHLAWRRLGLRHLGLPARGLPDDRARPSFGVRSLGNTPAPAVPQRPWLGVDLACCHPRLGALPCGLAGRLDGDVGGDGGAECGRRDPHPRG